MNAKKSIFFKLIREIIRPIKQFFDLLFNTIPTICRDTYRYFTFSNVEYTGFRGKFYTFKEAMDSAPKNASSRGETYKDAFLPSIEDILKQMKTRRVRQTEYPMFFWLNMIAEACKNKGIPLSVLDFGGVYGGHYFSFVNSIRLLDINNSLAKKLKWQVVEVPRQVELGNKIIKTLDIKNLHFMTDMMNAQEHNVLISSSAFQYIDNLFDLLKKYFNNCSLNKNGGGGIAEHIILTDFQFQNNGDTFVTLQNVRNEFYTPFYIFNEKKFIEFFESFGYEVFDIWDIPYLTNLKLPFHRDYIYSKGIYFRKKF